jgi:hypothetical protein
MSLKLSQSIVSTLAFFDVFDYPLTREELYRWLWMPKPISYADFVVALDSLQGAWDRVDGFYILSGREEIVHARQKSISLVAKKMKIAQRGVKKMRWIPFVQAVFLCNTVAAGSAAEESDIDVFVVVKHGRIWITRFLVTTVLALFRLRRNKTSIANKICLSFYVTDTHLDLSGVAINAPDIYLIYWIDQLVPLYDPDNILHEIHTKNNWVKKYIPNAFLEYDLIECFSVKETKISNIICHIFETMWRGGYGDLLEKQARDLQKQKMKKNLGSKQDDDSTDVVISDTMLKFHENDQREFFKKAWEDLLGRVK